MTVRRYEGCLVCGTELTKDDNFIRPRHIETGYGCVKGKCCNSCYEIYKEHSVWEILGK